MNTKLNLPCRSKTSYKGEVGKTMIIGGSDKYYGAPILAALGAERSGSDLITLCLPAKYAETARNYSLNFFIHEFTGPNLSTSDVEWLVKLSEAQDVVVIGNGLGKDKGSVEALLEVLSAINKPILIDAEGLVPEILNVKRKSKWVITPHKGEFKRLFNAVAEEKVIVKKAREHDLTIIVKGMIDIIVDANGQKCLNEKPSCPEMHVGGTGDVLAGIIGSFIAQKMDPFDACCSSAYLWGTCGVEMVKKRKWLTAHDMIMEFPAISKKAVK